MAARMMRLGPKVHLSAEHLKQVRSHHARIGRYRLATSLGITVATLDNALGGLIREATRDKIVSKLKEIHGK